jgi:hypothetical protein
MITTLTVCFTKYLSIPFEDFTAKYVTARGLFMLMDSFDKDDEKKMKSFEEKISDKVPISLYKLDRYVNPSKREFDTSVGTVIFKYMQGRDIKSVSLDEAEIQQLLCVAIREVHEIILKNMKKYQLEQPVNYGESADEVDILKLLKG